MRETLLLLLLMSAMTAFTLRPMLADPAPDEATLPAAGTSEELDEEQGTWLLAETLAAYFPGHARLRAEAAAGDRPKW